MVAETSLDYNYVVETESKDGIIKKKPMSIGVSIEPMLSLLLTHFSKSCNMSSIQQTFNGLKIDTPLNCHFGLVVTGSGLIRTANKVDEIVSIYHNVVGLDMETCGFYYAAKNTLDKYKPYFASIKSVSDFANTEKMSLPATERRQYAIFTSVQFLKKFIIECLSEKTNGA